MGELVDIEEYRKRNRKKFVGSAISPATQISKKPPGSVPDGVNVYVKINFIKIGTPIAKRIEDCIRKENLVFNINNPTTQHLIQQEKEQWFNKYPNDADLLEVARLGNETGWRQFPLMYLGLAKALKEKMTQLVMETNSDPTHPPAS